MNYYTKRRAELLTMLSKGSLWMREEICFSILYRTPLEFQLNLAIETMRRYLPIWKFHGLDDRIFVDMLQDPFFWFSHRAKENYKMSEPEMMPDASFEYSFYALIHVLEYPTNPGAITSGCVGAIGHTISARGTNIWVSDDPEAEKLRQEEKLPPDRFYDDHVGYQAIVKREWDFVADWLEQHGVAELVDEVDPKELALVLKKWEEYEGLMILWPAEEEQKPY